MIRVNAERLWSTLEMMAQIGGTPAGGVTRLALSEEDRIARNLLRDWALAGKGTRATRTHQYRPGFTSGSASSWQPRHRRTWRTDRTLVSAADVRPRTV